MHQLHYDSLYFLHIMVASLMSVPAGSSSCGAIARACKTRRGVVCVHSLGVFLRGTVAWPTSEPPWSIGFRG
jgi:hypothetical protein